MLGLGLDAAGDADAAVEAAGLALADVAGLALAAAEAELAGAAGLELAGADEGAVEAGAEAAPPQALSTPTPAAPRRVRKARRGSRSCMGENPFLGRLG
jgi:hypothetical protein